MRNPDKRKAYLKSVKRIEMVESRLASIAKWFVAHTNKQYALSVLKEGVGALEAAEAEHAAVSEEYFGDLGKVSVEKK